MTTTKNKKLFKITFQYSCAVLVIYKPKDKKKVRKQALHFISGFAVCNNMYSNLETFGCTLYSKETKQMC